MNEDDTPDGLGEPDAPANHVMEAEPLAMGDEPKREAAERAALNRDTTRQGDALTVEELVRLANGNAIMLLEAAVQAGASDEYRRNGSLQQILRAYTIEQVPIRDYQERLAERARQKAAAG